MRCLVAPSRISTSASGSLCVSGMVLDLNPELIICTEEIILRFLIAMSCSHEDKLMVPCEKEALSTDVKWWQTVGSSAQTWGMFLYRIPSPSPKKFLYVTIGNQVTDLLGCQDKGRNTKTCLLIITKGPMTLVVHKLVSGLIPSSLQKDVKLTRGSKFCLCRSWWRHSPCLTASCLTTADVQSASLCAQQLYLPACILKDSAAKCTETGCFPASSPWAMLVHPKQL